MQYIGPNHAGDAILQRVYNYNTTDPDSSSTAGENISLLKPAYHPQPFVDIMLGFYLMYFYGTKEEQHPHVHGGPRWVIVYTGSSDASIFMQSGYNSLNQPILSEISLPKHSLCKVFIPKGCAHMFGGELGALSIHRTDPEELKETYPKLSSTERYNLLASFHKTDTTLVTAHANIEFKAATPLTDLLEANEYYPTTNPMLNPPAQYSGLFKPLPNSENVSSILTPGQGHELHVKTTMIYDLLSAIHKAERITNLTQRNNKALTGHMI